MNIVWSRSETIAYRRAKNVACLRDKLALIVYLNYRIKNYRFQHKIMNIMRSTFETTASRRAKNVASRRVFFLNLNKNNNL
jgi:hypothetical protein